MVFLPHDNDSNRTHRRTYETFCSLVADDAMHVHARLNMDAKILPIQLDLYMYSGEKDAA